MKRLSDDELKDIARRQSESSPRMGERWRHHGGKLVVIALRAIREDTHEDVVIYSEAGRGVCWERTLADFTATVEVDGVARPRFERLG